MTRHAQKLTLGTAQFGGDYGIAGGRRVPPEEIARILDLAAGAGVDMLDTAAVYGDAEAVIGAQPRHRRFRIVSKIPPLDGMEPATAVRRAAEQSLQRLDVERLHGLLVHRAEDLLGSRGDALWRVLSDLREEGIAERIGVSAYRPAEIETIHVKYAPDLVQIPFNVLDQRLFATDLPARLRTTGTEIHVRSVFLQGLLLMAPDARPDWTGPWRTRLDACWHWASGAGLAPVAACLRFALEQPCVDRVVVGVDNRHQLQALLMAAQTQSPLPPADELACDDERLIHPMHWPE